MGAGFTLQASIIICGLLALLALQNWYSSTAQEEQSNIITSLQAKLRLQGEQMHADTEHIPVIADALEREEMNALAGSTDLRPWLEANTEHPDDGGATVLVDTHVQLRIWPSLLFM